MNFAVGRYVDRSQLAPRRRGCPLRGPRCHDDVEIPVQTVPHGTKRLADQALESVSLDAVPELFPDGNAESGAPAAVFQGTDRDITTALPDALFVGALEFTVRFDRKSRLHRVWKTKNTGSAKTKSYAERTFLPLALLLLRTFLPLAVDILALKPCTLLLCLVLGWKGLII